MSHISLLHQVTSSVETVSRVSTNKFLDRTRSLVHIQKYNNVTPDYLMMALVLKNKSSSADAQDLVIHVIVYGITGIITMFHWVCGIKWQVKINFNRIKLITSDILYFITPVKMTKELKMQPMVNDDNPIRKKVLTIRVKVYNTILMILLTRMK